jgi:hypothetical protein
MNGGLWLSRKYRRSFLLMYESTMVLSEDNLTNNKPSFSIFQHNLNKTSHMIKSSLLVNQNFPNKDIGFTVARCTKELEKIMTLESLLLSLALLRKTVRETTPDGPLGFTYIRNVVLIAVHAFIMLWIHSTSTGFTGKLWRNGRIAIVHAI